MTIQRREKSKHTRYPGLGLYPFVLDTRGKWGREAQAMVQALTIDMDPEERRKALQCCRYTVARALQLRAWPTSCSARRRVLATAPSLPKRALAPPLREARAREGWGGSRPSAPGGPQRVPLSTACVPCLV